MDKIWLKSYSEDIKKDIMDELSDCVNLYQTFVEQVKKHPNSTAVECLGKKLTFMELNNLADNFSSFCVNKLSMKKGERLGIMLPNILDYYICIFGGFKAGLTIVGFNPMYTVNELSYQMKDADLKSFVVLDLFADKLKKAIEKSPVDNIIFTSVYGLFSAPKRMLTQFVLKYIKKTLPKISLNQKYWVLRNELQENNEKQISPVELKGEDIAFLQYTGGTTGKAKGVILTHNNILANVLQIKALLPKSLNTDSVWIAPLPLFHIFALTGCLSGLLSSRGYSILIPNPRNIKGLVKSTINSKCDVITGVNTLFGAMVNNNEFKSGDYSNLKMTWAGGMPVQQATADSWHEITGCPMHVAYGLSETSPGVSADLPTDKVFSNSIGYPFPSTDIKIINSESKQEVGIGEEGELCIKGPQVMKGYWRNEKATHESLIDGWFHSGDIAKINEFGRLKLVDRVKDMVIVSGFNVYSVEVENILTQIPEILSAAVIGIPFEKTGEKIKAFIVFKEGMKLDNNEIMSLCRKNLTSYKIPRVFEIIKELPLTSVGKIDKKALRLMNKI